MQTQRDYEKQERRTAEMKLLEAEKKNNNLTVDLGQLQKQVDDLKSNIAEEIERVMYCFSLDLHILISCVMSFN